jgi:hypothetical protein
MANSGRKQGKNHGATNEGANFTKEFLDCFDTVTIQLKYKPNQKVVPSFAQLLNSGRAASQKNSDYFLSYTCENPEEIQNFTSDVRDMVYAAVVVFCKNSGLTGALEKQNFNVVQYMNDLTTALQMAHESPADSLFRLSQSEIFDGSSRCVCFQANSGKGRLLEVFKSRDPVFKRNQNESEVSVPALLESRAWPLVIFDGESGSGKTTLLTRLADPKPRGPVETLQCVFVVVFEATDDVKVIDDEPPDESELRKIQDVVDILALRMSKVKEKLSSKLQEAFGEATWIIAIDEASSVPIMLRTLCRQRAEIASEFGKALGIRRVRIVAAGTGSKTVCAPGSFPEDFQVLSLEGQPELAPPKGSSAGDFEARLNKRFFETYRTLKSETQSVVYFWNKLRAIPFIDAGLSNPRFAECVMLRCFKVVGGLKDFQPHMVTLATLQSIVTFSCLHFKSLNGCDKLKTTAGMMSAIGTAIQYAIAPRHQNEFPSTLQQYGMGRDIMEAKLKSEVNTDQEEVVDEWIARHIASKAPPSKAPPSKAPPSKAPPSKGLASKASAKAEQTVVGVVPKGEHRFAVSPQQWSLFALSYGHGEPLQTWPDFENSAALFLRMMMVGLKGETVRNALKALTGYLGLRSDGAPHKVFGPLPKTTLNQKLDYTDVLCWTEVNRLQKEDLLQKSDAWMRVKAAVDANMGAVILNAPGAKFADVIFASKQLVVLIQAKYYAIPASALSSTQMQEEMGKFGVTQEDPWLAPALSTLFNQGGAPYIVCGMLTTTPPFNLNRNFPALDPSQPICVLQWQVDDQGFVQNSKVKIRFPEPKAGRAPGSMLRAELASGSLPPPGPARVALESRFALSVGAKVDNVKPSQRTARAVSSLLPRSRRKRGRSG